MIDQDNLACKIKTMSYRTYREVMLEKLNEAFPWGEPGFVWVAFQTWTGWKTPTRVILFKSYLAMERLEDGRTVLSLVRAYADDESDSAWREFSCFEEAGSITTLSELIAEIKAHPGLFDSDYPLDVTDYESLIENLTDLVANDALIRSCRAA
jgi:hypothetical protein